MYLYNETIGIENTVEQEWLLWVKSNYIPEVLRTGLFVDYKFYKVLHETDDNTTSYCIQFFAPTLENVVQYLEVFAPVLVEQQRVKFNNKHVAFRTLLEGIE